MTPGANYLGEVCTYQETWSVPSNLPAALADYSLMFTEYLFNVSNSTLFNFTIVPTSIVDFEARRMGLPKRPSPISKPKAEKRKVESVVEEQDLPLRLELRQLVWSRSKCCWPTGDPKKNGFVFCGDTVVPGKPYCLPHCKEAYTTSRDAS